MWPTYLKKEKTSNEAKKNKLLKQFCIPAKKPDERAIL